MRGRVLAPGDIPLRNARVEINLDDRPFSVVLTDAAGRFAASAIPAGRYTLSAAKPGYVKTMLTTASGTPRRIDLRDSATIEGLDIRLNKAGAISGRVIDDTGEPIILERRPPPNTPSPQNNFL